MYIEGCFYWEALLFIDPYTKDEGTTKSVELGGVRHWANLFECCSTGIGAAWWVGGPNKKRELSWHGGNGIYAKVWSITWMALQVMAARLQVCFLSIMKTCSDGRECNGQYTIMDSWKKWYWTITKEHSCSIIIKTKHFYYPFVTKTCWRHDKIPTFSGRNRSARAQKTARWLGLYKGYVAKVGFGRWRFSDDNSLWFQTCLITILIWGRCSIFLQIIDYTASKEFWAKSFGLERKSWLLSLATTWYDHSGH